MQPTGTISQELTHLRGERTKNLPNGVSSPHPTAKSLRRSSEENWRDLFSRKDLNYPPTAVGGISSALPKPARRILWAKKCPPGTIATRGHNFQSEIGNILTALTPTSVSLHQGSEAPPISSTLSDSPCRSKQFACQHRCRRPVSQLCKHQKSRPEQ